MAAKIRFGPAAGRNCPTIVAGNVRPLIKISDRDANNKPRILPSIAQVTAVAMASLLPKKYRTATINIKPIKMAKPAKGEMGASPKTLLSGSKNSMLD